MKYCIKKYPMGSFPKQQSEGKYMDKTYYDNLRILAKKIVNDMTFLAVCYSSTLEVGTGKSVFVQSTGEAYTEMVNEIHGLDIKFTEKNIVFHPKDLINTALTLPKYSCIILDEWEDAHYWSELGITLRQFFRKCRQLNLFMIIICPNFFQLPVGYAISRSVFAIDVRFEGEFDRGYFRFYNFDNKKDLYIKGKKTYNYNVASCNFHGRFTDGYAVPRDIYETKKRNDLMKYEEKDKTKISEKDIKAKLFSTIVSNLKGVSIKELAEASNVTPRTAFRWIKASKQTNTKDIEKDSDTATQYNSIPI
jgi:hypothetical protein|tara:strand:- start:149 stop:1066 length:918 start_codon:yes stop_codon:yes gene_type:complete